ncbi:xanthine dehydrogenase family protein subunit M [Comamonas sp. NLF-1-9]|uniref:FAD binding domain-containing protein n=1 Tax=Comamonas sp. NLF-1-9 TaxID=2853163 RepID=UPI001C4413C9|nr:xanthine dehydrogenase family protein subunit M [Comamonas sp. NLF-1-9]QXL83805.1 xanthine dehydrogenase family protein subunit M [Comamonas sp. NLF-1-9]
MYAFTYERPSSQADALRLAKAGGKLLAGGQTLLASMKLRLAAPEQVVDLGGIEELAGIRKEAGAIVIGAMTRHCEVAESSVVQQNIPALAGLASGIGDKQVRARGTIGGSVANNDPAADYPAALLGLGATVHTHARTIAADDFFQGLFSTALDEGEIITAVSFPIPQRAAYMKFPQPASLFALIGVFVAQTAGGVRVAVTGGGNGVFRHAGMEQALSASFTPEAAAKVATDAGELSGDLHGSSQYRAHLVGVMTQRAVAQALA